MKCRFIALGVRLSVVIACAGSMRAGMIHVPNGSFESPTTSYVRINIDSWQEMPKPDWYVEDGSFLWTQLTGIFRNSAPGNLDHIHNIHGTQALWLFAVPDVGLFQDYDSQDWNDSEPSHAFDATFTVGKAYQLTTGVIGRGGNMPTGATLELSLYYRDATSNKVAVATTIITNSPALFPDTTNFVDFNVVVPTVRDGDPWAGEHIGIQFLSTTTTNLQGGYWDLDNVRLMEIKPPELSSPVWTNNQLRVSLTGETNSVFEMLSTTNPALPASEWTVVGTLTNESGTVSFVDTSGVFEQRYYQARQLP
ncbi:MAG TPA: hypothetical protein PKA41_17465 [Verrucomicrobiota bacterium]|nr:hypothetical protein [Verrucomicrobiota bacterium]